MNKEQILLQKVKNHKAENSLNYAFGILAFYFLAFHTEPEGIKWQNRLGCNGFAPSPFGHIQPFIILGVKFRSSFSKFSFLPFSLIIRMPFIMANLPYGSFGLVIWPFGLLKIVI